MIARMRAPLVFLLIAAISIQCWAVVYGVPDTASTLNPMTASGSLAWSVQELVFDFLLRADPQNHQKFENSLAQSWSISKDKKTYTFQLRPNLRWSDGEALTSADVVFSVEHLFQDEYKSNWRGLFQGFKNIKAVDQRTVRIEVAEPSYELWKNFATLLRILPKHIYGSAGASKQLLGEGPYVLKSFNVDHQVELQQNPRYWGEKEFKAWFVPREITFRSYPDTSAIANLLRHREIDIYPIDSRELERKLQGEPGLQFITDPNNESAKMEFLQLNLALAPLSDAVFRKTLNEAVDRKYLCEKIYGAAGGAAHSIWPQSWGSVKIQQRSIAETIEAFNKIGWQINKSNGLLEKNGRPAEFEIAYDSSVFLPTLTLLAENLKKTGIKVKFSLWDSALMQKNLKSGRYQAVIYRGSEDHDLYQAVWHSHGEFNFSHFQNPVVDQALNQYVAEFAADQRQRLARKVVQELIAATVAIPLCRYTATDYVARADLKLPGRKRGIPFWGWFSTSDP